jgi:hypothetical protein
MFLTLALGFTVNKLILLYDVITLKVKEELSLIFIAMIKGVWNAN